MKYYDLHSYLYFRIFLSCIFITIIVPSFDTTFETICDLRLINGYLLRKINFYNVNLLFYAALLHFPISAVAQEKHFRNI